MFAKLFALFALLAVAFANPNPKPDVLTYAAPGFVGYPGAALNYAAAPLAYPYAAAAAYPYSAYPTYYVK